MLNHEDLPTTNAARKDANTLPPLDFADPNLQQLVTARFLAAPGRRRSDVRCEEVQEWVRLTAQGRSIRAMAKATGRNPKSVASWLSRVGCPVSAPGFPEGVVGSKPGATLGTLHITDSDRAKMAADYVAGISLNTISARTGRSRNTVRKALRDSGIDILAQAPDRRVHVAREDALADWDDPQTRYWLGFAVADVCLQDRTTLKWTITAADGPWLQQFLAHVGLPDRPMTDQPATNSVQATLRSAGLCASLRKAGVTERGHGSERQLHPDLAMDPAAWLGNLDGDGCVYFRDDVPRLEWSGSRPLMDQCHQWLQTTTGRGWNPHDRLSQDGEHSLTTCGISGHGAAAIAQILLDACPASMPRKRQRLAVAAQWQDRRGQAA